MKAIATHPNLVSQVHQALICEIAQGSLRPGARVIQEQIADELGVSRQPVQQALLLLRNQGVLVDAPGRGLIVASLDLGHVQHMYDIRAVVEGLAFRKAAELSAEQARRLGPTLIRNGRDAAASGSVPDMIAADLRFHNLVHELSKNRWAAHLGAHVIGTAGSQEKADIAQAAGCADVILYRREAVTRRVREITGGRGVVPAGHPLAEASQPHRFLEAGQATRPIDLKA